MSYVFFLHLSKQLRADIFLDCAFFAEHFTTEIKKIVSNPINKMQFLLF